MPTDLTENPIWKKRFYCFGVGQKTAALVVFGIESYIVVATNVADL
jgi:hypothetical protein